MNFGSHIGTISDISQQKLMTKIDAEMSVEHQSDYFI